MKTQNPKDWKSTLDQIINGIDTPLGRAFDIVLICSISISSLLIIVDSVTTIHAQWGAVISLLQSFFLLVFSLEYILRLLVTPRKRDYLFSFYGVVDFIAIAPVYLSFFISFGSFFPIVRILRLLRLFSVFKMGRYITESGALLKALRASKTKISVFLFTLIFIVIIVGALMYTIEGPEHGFVSIPESMYWAVVTISTVGYGDISPQTELGKFLASALMLVGYGIIAVPTGIITSELTQVAKEKTSRQKCPGCGHLKNPQGAQYCNQCGQKL
ncbi:ion transporter [Acetobacterium wieringae]|uniref:Ion transporter n=1 Tax=Acetobacterium wieringae TaxID=52694 RepID=A0A5D0WIU7_9FIRM|nr:ion transporter [Acetobacterium wieringae]TYC83914.1 ion transporter [Acetobacterium wieringae]